MNGDVREQITYEQVQEGVDEIRKCANTMEDIFNNVSSEVKNITSDDVYKGQSRDAYSNEYAQFKGTFPNFLTKVREFADAYAAAAQVIRTTELEQVKKAQQI